MVLIINWMHRRIRIQSLRSFFCWCRFQRSHWNLRRMWIIKSKSCWRFSFDQKIINRIQRIISLRHRLKKKISLRFRNCFHLIHLNHQRHWLSLNYFGRNLVWRILFRLIKCPHERYVEINHQNQKSSLNGRSYDRHCLIICLRCLRWWSFIKQS